MMVFSWCGAIFYLTKWESRATVHDATVCPGCFGKAKLADAWHCNACFGIIFLLNIILDYTFCIIIFGDLPAINSKRSRPAFKTSSISALSGIIPPCTNTCISLTTFMAVSLAA